MLRIVGWHITSDIRCETIPGCTNPANVIVDDDNMYQSWSSCNEHAPTNARDEIAEVLRKAFR